MAARKYRYRPAGNVWFNGRDGRWYVQDRNNKTVAWARVVMEHKLRRTLTGDECVHHIPLHL